MEKVKFVRIKVLSDTYVYPKGYNFETKTNNKGAINIKGMELDGIFSKDDELSMVSYFVVLENGKIIPSYNINNKEKKNFEILKVYKKM